MGESLAGDGSETPRDLVDSFISIEIFLEID